MYHRAEMTSGEAIPHNLPDDSLEPEFEPVTGDSTESTAAAGLPVDGATSGDTTPGGDSSASAGIAPAAEPAPPEPGIRPVYWTPPTPEPSETPSADPGFQPVYWTPPTLAAAPASPEATASDPNPAPPEQPEPPGPASPEATTPPHAPAPAEPPEPPEPLVPEQPEAAASPEEAAGAASATSAEIERLRLEIAHRDQMLLVARERRLGLEREIGRLERQLDGAVEAQREAATERAELRRLLGNVQLQVQSLLQLPPPSGEYEDVGEVADVAPDTDDPTPPRARRPNPRTAESIIYAPPAGSSELPTTAAPTDQQPRRAPTQRRGLVDDARGVLSSLRRLF